MVVVRRLGNFDENRNSFMQRSKRSIFYDEITQLKTQKKQGAENETFYIEYVDQLICCTILKSRTFKLINLQTILFCKDHNCKFD